MDHRYLIWQQRLGDSEEYSIPITPIDCFASVDSEISIEIISPHKVYSCEYCFKIFRSSLKLKKHRQAFNSKSHELDRNNFLD